MTRISAVISPETQAQVDAYAKQLRIRKAVLIERALQYPLQALREIPSELMIPPRLVLDRDSCEQVVDRLARDEPPTNALRILMRGATDVGSRYAGWNPATTAVDNNRRLALRFADGL